MIKSSPLLFLFLLVGSLMAGQTQVEKPPFSSAEDLRKNYRFTEAIGIYQKIYDTCSDNSLREKVVKAITLCENGISMLAYSTTPSLRGSFTVPIKDFYLYYPDMPDSTWSLVPLILNKHKRYYHIHNAMIFDPQRETQYFSAQDSSGNWDIYIIEKIDSLKWSSPRTLDTIINSPGDELFPVLSEDGRRLFFSSDGHYGIGGFDLYVSSWDDETGSWGQPENMGFPFSSTGNDYLYVDTKSGKYTVIASDRDISGKDSVKIYVMDFENLAVKTPVSSPEDALRISKLERPENNTEDDKKIVDPLTPDTAATVNGNVKSSYSVMMREVKKIQSEIDSTIGQINIDRTLLSTLENKDDKAMLEKKIGETEFQLIEQQTRLRSVKMLVQELEMDFLTKGIILPREEFLSTGKTEPQDTVKEEVSIKLSGYGQLPDMDIVEPAPLVDLSFRVEQESLILEDMPLPEGLVYTVQLFILSAKTDASTFKGLNPVFEETTSSGKYIYSAGRFESYSELSSALSKIRSMRFANASAKAYHNGGLLSIREARLLEEKLINEQSFQVVLHGFPEGLPQPVLDVIRQNTDKDLAMKVIDGKSVYFIGPYSSRADAEKLAGVLTPVSEGVSIETIKQE